MRIAPGDELLVLGVGEHQDLGLLRQRARGRDAVHHRHADVQAHDVGLDLAGELDRLAAVTGLADDLDALGVGEQRGDAPPHDRVVVHE